MRLLAACTVMGFWLTSVGGVFPTRVQAELKPLPNRIAAPSLDGGIQWINTKGPLELKDLRGKFVLLDFWTYCCINCMQILPELKKLEAEFPNEIVVIGVHSAKFANERDSENIREAVRRYEVAHPVVNDANMTLWKKYAVDVWPSLRVIDPEGFVIAQGSGEIPFEDLRDYFRGVIGKYRAKRLLDETPLRFDLEIYEPHTGPLRHPGKVLADANSQRLFIADSGHNRIVVTSMNGKLLEVIGSGQIGSQDGNFDEATFDHPQGMALVGDDLYVADTENHMIRKIDFTSRRVGTVAGNGKQARVAARRARTTPTWIPLASPWDLLAHDKDLYIAMAGLHQIWKMELDGRTIGPYAGNAIEDIADGPLLPTAPYQKGFASFAQPSGLATDGESLFIADSEGSSIRAVPFDRNGRVTTIVGTSQLPSGRLFTFGDRDGPAQRALLQHPIGVAYDAKRIYVADTYNHKIRVIDLQNQPVVSTLDAGDFKEPAGLSVADGKLFIADTNHHRIATVDLARPGEAQTLVIDGLVAPKAPLANPLGNIPTASTESFPAVAVKPRNNAISAAIELVLPPNHKINEDAPMSYIVQVAGTPKVFEPKSVNVVRRVEKPAKVVEVNLPVMSDNGKTRVRISLVYYYCRDGAESVCMIGSVSWTGEISVSADASKEYFTLKHTIR